MRNRSDVHLSRVVDRATADPWPGDQWEYKSMSMKLNDDEVMSTMGQAGWELVVVIPVTIAGTGGAWLGNTVWKRRKGVSAAA